MRRPPVCTPGSRPRRRALAELIAKAVLGNGGAGCPAEASYVDGGSMGEQVPWRGGVRHDCGTCLSSQRMSGITLGRLWHL